MIGSLNKTISQTAEVDQASQKRWRRFAFASDLFHYSIYIFFRSRGFVSRYVLHAITYCVELYGIALFADTDIFSTASHITAAFFVVNLINYGGVLFYRSQLIKRANPSMRVIVWQSLAISLPVLAYSIYLSRSDFSYFAQTLLLSLVGLRVIDQLCELAAMIYTADLQVRCRIYFPFWMNFIFLALVFGGAAFSVYVLESVYALIFSTFVVRLLHVGYYWRQAVKTREIVYFAEPVAIRQQEQIKERGYLYLSLLVLLSPIILPLLVTFYSHVSHAEKLMTWLLQIVLAAFMVRPFTSIMVDVLQKSQSAKLVEIQRLLSMSTKLSWLSLGIVFTSAAILAIISDLPPILIAWCALAVVSKVMIYRSFLIGNEAEVYLPTVLLKYLLPIILYANRLITEEHMWLWNTCLEAVFVAWIIQSTHRTELVKTIEQKTFDLTSQDKLLLLNLSVSLKTLLLIKRFRNALGQNAEFILLNQRQGILKLPAAEVDSYTKNLILKMANWIAQIRPIETTQQLAKALGLSTDDWKIAAMLSEGTSMGSLAQSLASSLSVEYAQIPGVEAWYLDHDKAWVRKFANPSSEGLVGPENIFQIAHHNLMTKNVSARHYRLFQEANRYYYVVKNFEKPIVVVCSQGKNLELSHSCRALSRSIMFQHLNKNLTADEGVSPAPAVSIAA